jgi:hypothetical protein
MTKAQQAERAEYLDKLRAILRPGDKVYCVLANVSRSGMSREIKLYHINGEAHWLSGYAGKALGLRLGKHDGVIMGGCGMDMGFAVVYELGQALWPNGTDAPHGTRNGQPDSAGGYALKSHWL